MTTYGDVTSVVSQYAFPRWDWPLQNLLCKLCGFHSMLCAVSRASYWVNIKILPIGKFRRANTVNVAVIVPNTAERATVLFRHADRISERWGVKSVYVIVIIVLSKNLHHNISFTPISVIKSRTFKTLISN